MRGKVLLYERRKPRKGITPAYAGKSSTFCTKSVCFRDHPRLCGEKPKRFSALGQPLGSPPPMRGKDLLVVQPCTADGITPAYAGKSRFHFNLVSVDKDHPRLCGEKSLIVYRLDSQRGSPPPMRGKDPVFPFCSATYRITPAYAGKSFIFFFRISREQDHPRLCGEKR